MNTIHYFRSYSICISIAILILNGSCQEKPVDYKDQISNCYLSKTQNGMEIKYLDGECLIGAKFPVLYGKTVAGDTIDDNYFAKHTVINLWFENCAPCVAEIPGLNKLKQDYPDINFLSISTDREKYLLDFLSRTEFNMDHMVNGKEVIDQHIAQTGYPTTYILNKERIIIDFFSGGRTDSLAPIEIYNKVSEKLNQIIAKG